MVKISVVKRSINRINASYSVRLASRFPVTAHKGRAFFQKKVFLAFIFAKKWFFSKDVWKKRTEKR